MEQPSPAEGDDYVDIPQNSWGYRPGYVQGRLDGSKGTMSFSNLCKTFDWFVATVPSLGKNINGLISGNFPLLHSKHVWHFNNADSKHVIYVAELIKNNGLGYDVC